MKKTLILFIIFSTFFLASCASDIVNSGGIVVRGDNPKPTDIASYYAKEDVVYVTKSGTKYHKEDCPYLKDSKIPISLEQAKEEGLTPCSKCFGSGTDN